MSTDKETRGTWGKIISLFLCSRHTADEKERDDVDTFESMGYASDQAHRQDMWNVMMGKHSLIVGLHSPLVRNCSKKFDSSIAEEVDQQKRSFNNNSNRNVDEIEARITAMLHTEISASANTLRKTKSNEDGKVIRRIVDELEPGITVMSHTERVVPAKHLRRTQNNKEGDSKRRHRRNESCKKCTCGHATLNGKPSSASTWSNDPGGIVKYGDSAFAQAMREKYLTPKNE
ncbi:hypothetical protein CAPTEDRAFT_204189 [Capitella teleta]|uniref:Uncharacterized protein n=1 Tax=Capitella teleta TaxID=283909 RepID=R7UJM5_CAPTE|nr:hypothetical protein CAPTEDRAFT_204189 [Capitella teleta]|eukprot:ELU06318.1 hypothetical protein CAPTEDRAFT_204189 [Capitella teleta]